MSKLKFLKTTWGVNEFAQPSQWDSLLSKIKSSGFDGIEVALIGFRFNKIDKMHYPQLKHLIKKYEMNLVVQIHTCDYPEIPSNSVYDHLHSFRQQLCEAQLLKPNLINSHSGRDSWNVEKSTKFFLEALKMEQDENIPVTHETHRQRCLYNPWNTLSIIEKVPQIKINADLSHWVCVAERIFDDKTDPEWPSILQEIASRTHLIHSRVGHPQGPQVNDPRTRENQFYLEQHEMWWKHIIETQKTRNGTLYIEPEFGPHPYMQTLPNSDTPVADLWEITDWMKNRHKKMFL